MQERSPSTHLYGALCGGRTLPEPFFSCASKAPWNRIILHPTCFHLVGGLSRKPLYGPHAIAVFCFTPSPLPVHSRLLRKLRYSVLSTYHSGVFWTPLTGHHPDHHSWNNSISVSHTSTELTRATEVSWALISSCERHVNVRLMSSILRLSILFHFFINETILLPAFFPRTGFFPSAPFSGVEDRDNPLSASFRTPFRPAASFTDQTFTFGKKYTSTRQSIVDAVLISSQSALVRVMWSSSLAMLT